VATIEIPNSHQGIFLPERKNSEELFPAFLVTASPMARDKIKNPTTNPQSTACNIIFHSCQFVDKYKDFNEFSSLSNLLFLIFLDEKLITQDLMNQAPATNLQ
jgi:phage-related protein